MDTRRPPVWWELPLGLVAFLACTSLSRASLGDKAATARANAEQVVQVEALLRLDIEEPANRWFAGQGWMTVLAGYHYAAVYVLTSVALLVFLYLRHPPTFRWARRSTLLLNLIAAVCFALYPVAPPRLNPELTIVDTVTAQGIWGSWGSPIGDAVNQLAALPSLHFAWVLWVLAMLVISARRRVLGRALSIILITLASTDIVLTAVVVVVTGNHYPLDLVAGAALVAVSIPATRPWSPPTRERFARRLGRLGDALRSRAVLTDDADASSQRSRS